jgi:hypothetical protein
VQNAKKETIYLLHEERSLSSTPGGFSVSRTLLTLTEKSLMQAARIDKTGVNAAQPVDEVIPFAALLK